MRFTKVDSEESFKKWREFAATFDHGSDSPYLPIVMVDEDGENFGYWSTLTFPVVMPAFSPEKTSPRRFRLMVDAISNAHQIASLSSLQHPHGSCYLALEKSPAIDKEIIEKLGFKPMGLELWRKA